MGRYGNTVNSKSPFLDTPAFCVAVVEWYAQHFIDMGRALHSGLEYLYLNYRRRVVHFLAQIKSKKEARSC